MTTNRNWLRLGMLFMCILTLSACGLGRDIEAPTTLLPDGQVAGSVIVSEKKLIGPNQVAFTPFSCGPRAPGVIEGPTGPCQYLGANASNTAAGAGPIDALPVALAGAAGQIVGAELYGKHLEHGMIGAAERTRPANFQQSINGVSGSSSDSRSTSDQSQIQGMRQDQRMQQDQTGPTTTIAPRINAWGGNANAEGYGGNANAGAIATIPTNTYNSYLPANQMPAPKTSYKYRD